MVENVEETFAVLLGSEEVALILEKLIVNVLVTVVARGKVVVDADIETVLVLFALVCRLEVAE